MVESEELSSAAVADEVVVGGDMIATGAGVLAGELSRHESQSVGVLGANAVPFA